MREVDHVSDKNLDGHLAFLTLLDPLLNFFEALPFGYVEHKEYSSRADSVFVDVLMVALLAWHVEVDNFVLVCVVDIVGCLEMQFS